MRKKDNPEAWNYMLKKIERKDYLVARVVADVFEFSFENYIYNSLEKPFVINGKYYFKSKEDFKDQTGFRFNHLNKHYFDTVFLKEGSSFMKTDNTDFVEELKKKKENTKPVFFLDTYYFSNFNQLNLYLSSKFIFENEKDLEDVNVYITHAFLPEKQYYKELTRTFNLLKKLPHTKQIMREIEVSGVDFVSDKTNFPKHFLKGLMK